MSYLIDADSDERLDPLTWPYPALIHGVEGRGASYATVVLAAELIRAGESVVWMCAKPAAVRLLQTELGLVAPAPVATKEVSTGTFQPLADSQLVTMFGDAPFLVRSLRALPDWNERYVFLKNIETTLDATLWAILNPHSHLVLSGDVSHMHVPIREHEWPTQIGFSPWPEPWGRSIGDIPTYVGELQVGKKKLRRIMAIDRPTTNPQS